MTDSPNGQAVPEQVAAIDLGSNSFHMIVGRFDNDQLVIVDRIKEAVRLGAGLTSSKDIDDATRERALDCLSRFGQRLRAFPRHAVRAVGTNTMRRIQDKGAFLRAAEEALGHPIEIIAGREEARLIYLGVAHDLAAAGDRRLVVDIGGGSTEVIIGRGMASEERESLYMGCVNMTQRFFGNGDITREAMQAAMLAAKVELRPVRTLFRAGAWDNAVGSSGTIKAIGRAVRENGWSDSGISASGLKKLRKALIAAGHIDRIQLPGLSESRHHVIPGGVAVLSAVFERLQIEQMQVSEYALREGLLYEMLGVIHHDDTRDRTVDSLVSRYGIDVKQGKRVEMTANALLAQVGRAWNLMDRDHALMLGWAARLHEIGLAVSHNSFHKHGAYLLTHADLPGFSRQQQATLAALVRVHRRKFAQDAFANLPPGLIDCVRHLAVLLRLSVLLHRGRSGSGKSMFYLDVEGDTVRTSFPEGWLEDHPLTRAELALEADYLAAAGIALQIGADAPAG